MSTDNILFSDPAFEMNQISDAEDVGSRQVFITVGIIYILFGIIGKVCAAFITIPYPVLGGALITMLGIFMGVILSNPQVMDMSSSRNLAVVGLSIFMGYMIPNWIKDRKGGIKTGNPTADNLFVMILGNPNLAGTLLACFLDNTVPGTAEERGIAAWQVKEEDETATLDPQYEEGYEVYRPILPKAFSPIYSIFTKPSVLHTSQLVESVNTRVEPRVNRRLMQKTGL